MHSIQKDVTSPLAFQRTSTLTHPLIAQTDIPATPDKDLSVRFGKVIVRNPVRETSSSRWMRQPLSESVTLKQ